MSFPVVAGFSATTTAGKEITDPRALAVIRVLMYMETIARFFEQSEKSMRAGMDPAEVVQGQSVALAANMCTINKGISAEQLREDAKQLGDAFGIVVEHRPVTQGVGRA